MTAERPDRDGSDRFGFRLAGVPLQVPAKTTALFLPAAGIDPMPLAPPRLRGFMQRQGRPIPVFDASADPPDRLPVRTRRPVLVFDGLPEPAALLVDAPPERIGPLLGPATDAGAGLPRVAWREAIGAGSVDAQGGSWWSVDLARLFDTLARP